MLKNKQQSVWGVFVVWGCVWFAFAWILEHVRQGFVVNWINTKWLVVFVVMSGVIYLFTLVKQKNV
ncbi:MAG TPA: hypothetical protein DDW36_01565 [Candidatus Magasanikbacteria bacterium]|nr:hypothetical protein [Candidatus Magasanikbacteria bacterium]